MIRYVVSGALAAALAAFLLAGTASAAGGNSQGQSGNSQGQNGQGGGGIYTAPEFDPATAGAVAAIIAGAGVLVGRTTRTARRR